MGRQDARQKKMGSRDARRNKDWETRHETKKMGRQDVRQKKWEEETRDQKKNGESRRETKENGET